MGPRRSISPKLGMGLALGALLAWTLSLLSVAYTPRSRVLHDLNPLLAQQRFDEAELRIRRWLRERPDDIQANMLMAQVALARKDQKPRLALKHLRMIETADPATLAIVRLNEGKAYSALGRYNLAESSWREALRLDPLVPEAGWALLGLFYVQGRRSDATRLVMRLQASEPDPRDRVQLLLELVRQDAKSLVTETVVSVLEPVVVAHPEDLHSRLALGKALVQTSRCDDGLKILSELLAEHSQDLSVWDGWLRALDDSFRHEELGAALCGLPSSLAGHPALQRHFGAFAQSQRDWTTAAACYRRAWDHDPTDGQSLYRLCQVLRASGSTSDLERFEQARRRFERAREQTLSLYEKANAIGDLGLVPRPDLYQEIAQSREYQGMLEEAVAWHRLVLSVEPSNEISRQAIQRLASKPGGRPPDPHHAPLAASVLR